MGYNLPNNKYLNVWIDKPKTNDEVALPLSNAVKVSSNPRIKKSCDDMIGFLYASNNDLQHASMETLITSSIYTGGNGGGVYINSENLWQAAIIFSVRRLIKPTWLNDRDQFLQPTKELTDEFKNDCLIWMLFNGSNLTASANNLEWNGKMWSIVNHFIPFTEAEVNAPERFESDFMAQYLEKKKLSKEAKAVLDAGRELWKAYFSETDVYNVREEFKLNRADVGWYQIRNALKKRIETPVDFGDFEMAYKNLSAKCQPLVYELGFLRA